MNFRNNINLRIKKLNWIDIKLLKLGSISLGVMLAALFPQLIEIKIWWIIAVTVLLLIKPLYKILVLKI